MTESKNSSVVAGLYDATKLINGAPIVENASLEVSKGEIVIITGESGSGKSTVMRMLSGIERPDRGRAVLFGRDIGQLTQPQLDRVIARRVGVGFQAPNLDTNRTVIDNLTGLTEARGGEVDLYAAARILVRLGLQDDIDKKASVLSGGEKLMLAFGRLILPQPELVLLDEPTYALDHANKVDMFRSIASACRDGGMSALIVTHDALPAREIADRELIMASGRIVDQVSYSTAPNMY